MFDRLAERLYLAAENERAGCTMHDSRLADNIELLGMIIQEPIETAREFAEIAVESIRNYWHRRR